MFRHRTITGRLYSTVPNIREVERPEGKRLEEIQRFINTVGNPLGSLFNWDALIEVERKLLMGGSKTRVLKIDYHGKTVLRADYDAVVKGRAYGRAAELSTFPHLCDVKSLSGHTRGVVIRRAAQEAQKEHTYARVVVKPGEKVVEFVRDNPDAWTWAVLTRDGMGFYGCDEQGLAGAWKPYSIETKFRVGGHLFTLKDMQEIQKAFEAADVEAAVTKTFNEAQRIGEAAKIVHLAPVVGRYYNVSGVQGVVITGSVQHAYRRQFGNSTMGAYTVLTKIAGNHTYQTIAALLRWWRPV